MDRTLGIASDVNSLLIIFIMNSTSSSSIIIISRLTGNVSFGLPIMIVLMVAKWVGDLFTEGIYDEHIGLAKVPLLSWEAPPITSRRRAVEVMSTPVTVFRPTEKVSVILKYLKVR